MADLGLLHAYEAGRGLFGEFTDDELLTLPSRLVTGHPVRTMASGRQWSM